MHHSFLHKRWVKIYERARWLRRYENFTFPYSRSWSPRDYYPSDYSCNQSAIPSLKPLSIHEIDRTVIPHKSKHPPMNQEYPLWSRDDITARIRPSEFHSRSSRCNARMDYFNDSSYKSYHARTLDFQAISLAPLQRAGRGNTPSGEVARIYTSQEIDS